VIVLARLLDLIARICFPLLNFRTLPGPGWSMVECNHAGSLIREASKIE
jgi:hypothetical protein